MRLLGFFLVLTLSSQTYANESLFDLSLEELLKIELQGDTTKSIDLRHSPISNNYFGIKTLKLPYSVQSVTSDTIKAHGIKNIVEVVEKMTGILSGESPSEPYSFSTRGFSRNSIDVVYDGLSMGLATLNMRPQNTFNVSSVEFIKGNSTLSNGEGAAGGTINIITKKANITGHHTREALLITSEYNSNSVNLAFSGPLSDQSAYRMDLSQNNSDGWVERTGSMSTNLSGSVIWEPKDELSVLFSLIYLDDELPAYWGTPYVPRTIALKPNDNVVSGKKDLTIDETIRFNNYNVQDNDISSESLWKRVDVNWTLGENLKSTTTLYQFSADRNWQNSENYFYNSILNQVERDRLLVNHDRDNWGLQSIISSQYQIFSRPSQSSLKFELHNIDFNRDVGFNLSSPDLYWDSIDLFAPISGEFGFVDHRSDSLNQTTKALIFNNITEVTSYINLNVSLRAETIGFDRKYINWDGSKRERTSIVTEFNEISYNLGLSYELSKTSTIYGHYNYTHDPIFDDSFTVYELNNLQPSNVTQAEVGYKTINSSSDTEFTFAIFNINKDLVTQISSDANVFISSIQSQGIESSINIKLSDRLNIGADVTVLDTQYGEYYDSKVNTLVSNNTPENVPKLVSNIRFSYEFETFPIEIGAGSIYVSSRWADGANTIKLNDYFTQNLYISYHGGNYHFALHVKNLTDELYVPWSDVYYPNQVILAPPRQISLSYLVNF